VGALAKKQLFCKLELELVCWSLQMYCFVRWLFFLSLTAKLSLLFFIRLVDIGCAMFALPIADCFHVELHYCCCGLSALLSK